MRISFEFSKAELDALNNVAKAYMSIHRQMADGVDKLIDHLSSLTKDGVLTIVVEPPTPNATPLKKQRLVDALTKERKIGRKIVRA